MLNQQQNANNSQPSDLAFEQKHRSSSIHKVKQSRNHW